METRGSRRELLLVVLLAVQWSYSAQTAYREGGELDLKPDFSGDINFILWKYKSSLVAEWSKSQENAVTYYSTYRNRTNLDRSNGHLKITHLRVSDSGVYSVEFNNKVHERYTVEVLKAVPRPTVEVKPLACSNKLKTCNLTCDGNVDGSGPVTYRWKIGDKEWKDGEPNLTINNDKETQEVKTFSCQLQSLINTETSEPVKNPFYVEKPIVVIVVVVVFVISLFAVGGVGFWKRKLLMEKISKYRGVPTTNGNTE